MNIKSESSEGPYGSFLEPNGITQEFNANIQMIQSESQEREKFFEAVFKAAEEATREAEERERQAFEMMTA